MSSTDSEPKSKADVYEERNLLALAFIEAVRREAYLAGYAEEFASGWWPDTDDVNGEEWAVVWFDDPHHGQFGWHVPREMVPDWLQKRDPEYDGYTTADKYRRLVAGWIDPHVRVPEGDR